MGSQIEDSFGIFLKEKDNELIAKSCVFLYQFLDKDYYIHRDDGNPYDSSGEVIKTSFKNRDKINSVQELMECFTGEKMASYESGCGWFYNTVDSELWNYQNEYIFDTLLAEYILANKEYLDSFKFKLDDGETLHTYFNMNDIVGCANCEIELRVENYLDKIDLELMIDIAKSELNKE